jgi:vacuolar-type H+-ATPase subunit F/Vma7
MKILVVDNEDTNIMFQLLGIDSYEIKSNDPIKFQAEFDKILENTDIGLIIMNEKYLLRNKEYFKQVKNRKSPIIIEIPDLFSPLSHEYYKEFIETYIGLNMV